MAFYNFNMDPDYMTSTVSCQDITADEDGGERCEACGAEMDPERKNCPECGALRIGRNPIL